MKGSAEECIDSVGYPEAGYRSQRSANGDEQIFLHADSLEARECLHSSLQEKFNSMTLDRQSVNAAGAAFFPPSTVQISLDDGAENFYGVIEPRHPHVMHAEPL